MAISTIYYRVNSQKAFLGFCRDLSDDVNHSLRRDAEGVDTWIDLSDARYKLMQAFPRFKDLFSVSIPKAMIHEGRGSKKNLRKRSTKIHCVTSYNQVLGYIEAIPLIGSVIAPANAFFHYIRAWRNSVKVRQISLQFRSADYVAQFYRIKTKDVVLDGEFDDHSGYVSKEKKDFYVLAHDLFNTAVSYTVHRNQYRASLMSIIPCLKPIVRIAQAYFRARS